MNSTTSGGTSSTISASTSDLDHDDDGPRMVAAAFATWAIALIFVLLRLYTRAFIARVLGPADWCISLAVFTSAACAVAYLGETRNGLGRHVWDIRKDEYPLFMRSFWFTLLWYTLSLALTKISICLLYLTVFTLEWAQRASYAVLTVVVIVSIWSNVSVLTACIPLRAYWDKTVEPTFCQPQSTWWGVSGLTVATDILIFLLPIPVVLPLKLPRRQKIVVVGIFTIGGFICIISLVRLGILIRQQVLPDPDFTHNSTPLTYWTVLEVNGSIVIACLMTLKPLVTKFYPDLLNHPDSEDEPSAASNDPPLTIGSKPSRNPLTPARRASWIEVADQNGIVDVMLQDIEAQGEANSSHPEPGDTTIGIAKTITDDKGNIITTEIRVPGSSFSHNDGASERTEEIGPEVTARSIG
ncbi:hypothetical protein B0T17DRAFT_90797 [Bombardia bombarda]|uniref:Rhodopsin domain-containing protein n=1 Tax=Bombardia bombarda TaxID=252184 RepID=A0AA39XP36_9PEZI|nr:hypothetical protein B0T17DRAFT_90797 [Bombardia bombarda]